MSATAPRTRRASKKAATRRALVGAARERFIAAGVADTGAGDIARAAGVAHGTFYVHFANKDAIVRELVGALNAELARRVAAELARTDTRELRRVVRRAAAAFLDYWAEERTLIARLAEHMIAGLSLAELRDGVNPPAAELLVRGLTELATRRRVRAPQVELLAHALLAMWLRVGLRYLFTDGVRRGPTLDLLSRLTTSSIDALLPPEETDVAVP